MQSLLLAAIGLSLATPGVPVDPGEVTAVSVLPGPGSALVVIDVRGDVTVQDFTLSNPPRLVIDVLGAKWRAPWVHYDGVRRGGIINIRHSQFRPDVVRIVLELESLTGYRLEYSDDAIRITLGSDRSFTAWSSAVLRQRLTAQAERRAPPVAPPPVPTAQQAVQQEEQPRITVAWEAASLADVIAGFSQYSGKSIVLGLGTEAEITAEIKDQPWDVAFKAILNAHELTAIEDPPGIIQVTSNAIIAARDSLEPLATRIIPVDFARATSLVQAVAFVIPEGRGGTVADTLSNSLIITAPQSRLDSIESVIRALDKPAKQVSIQAKLIFVNRTDIEDLGVRYDLGTADAFFNRVVQRGDPTTAQPVDLDGDGVPDALQATETFPAEDIRVALGGNALAAIANARAAVASPALELIFSTAIGNFALTSFVEALEQVELSDLQAEPLVSTSDNTLARIVDGDQIAVRQLEFGAQSDQARVVTNFFDTGIKLEVTPHVTAAGQILLDLIVENSSISAAQAELISIRNQRSESEVLVNDGETAVIGGLTVTDVSVRKSGIPLLSDLPIIGRMFGFTQRRESRRDLLILVTPHIIQSPEALTEERP